MMMALFLLNICVNKGDTMKKKLLTILLSLSSITAYADPEMCRKVTVGFGEYMETLAPQYEENEEALKVKKAIRKFESYYKEEFINYGKLYKLYMREGMKREADMTLKFFQEVATKITNEVAIYSKNKYKAKVTLNLDENDTFKVNWYVFYGQVVRNNQAKNFNTRQELYKNIITDRPAIINSGKNLEGERLEKAEMVEFESLEMMSMFLSKDVRKICEKYLDFIETKKADDIAALSNSSRELLSKSFAYMVRAKDKEFFVGPGKMSFGVRSYYYDDITKALSIYESETENMNNENRSTENDFRSSEPTSSSYQNSYSTQE